MELLYRTRGNSSPQGKERVYFTSHPDDFNVYFEEIVQDIHRFQNCAIYYNTDIIHPLPDDEINELLRPMQLMVIPITKKFLFTENYARRKDFKYAMEHHIPVLPLMQEPHLEDEFNRICGNLQFLDKKSLDVTAISYDEKMRSFLKSVLLGDELAEKVRSEFDAYVFLSYRKKDRKYAQELMQQIHKNKQFQDIAIWYDEYLVPGEDFNDSIKCAMERSKLFAMVVTPNLLEKPNYVMDYEYKDAKRMEKTIIPACMINVDIDELKKCFDGIPDTLDASNEEQLYQALSSTLGKYINPKNDNDPIHNSLIGLAYLNGIDVEVNHERGVNLITSAAQQNHPGSMMFLVDMYSKGKGVEQNYKTALFWQKKIVEGYKKAFERNSTEEQLHALLFSMVKMASLYGKCGDESMMSQTYQNALELCEKWRDKWDLHNALVAINSMIGNFEESIAVGESWSPEKADPGMLSMVYFEYGLKKYDEGNIPIAEKYLKKGIAVGEKLLQTNKPNDYVGYLAKAYGRLGLIELERENFLSAQKNFERSCELAEPLTLENRDEDNFLTLAMSTTMVGEALWNQGHPEKAWEYFQKGISLEYQYSVQTDSRWDLLYSELFVIAHYADETYNYGKAVGIYKIAVEAMEKVCQSGKSDKYNNSNLSWIYERLGEALYEIRDYEESKIYYEKAINVRNDMLNGDSNNLYYLCKDCEIIAGILLEIENVALSKEYLNRFIEFFDQLSNIDGAHQPWESQAACYKHLGKISQYEGDTKKAYDYYKQSLEIREVIAEKIADYKEIRLLVEIYHTIGDMLLMMVKCEEASEKEEDEAIECYKKSIPLCETLIKMTHNTYVEVLCKEQLAMSYLKYGLLGSSPEPLEKALEILFDIQSKYSKDSSNYHIVSGKIETIKSLLKS